MMSVHSFGREWTPMKILKDLQMTHILMSFQSVNLEPYVIEDNLLENSIFQINQQNLIKV